MSTCVQQKQNGDNERARTHGPHDKAFGITREYFKRLATISSPEKALLYKNLEDPGLTKQIQETFRASDITRNSMLRTSISPNIFRGGFRNNVIPGDAEATLDVRALPDEDMEAFSALCAR